jgi:hypothetical protein
LWRFVDTLFFLFCGGTASKRGVSNEQVCILVARDCSGQTLGFVIGTGALSKLQLTQALKPVLDDDVLMISDGNPPYAAFCHQENLSHEVATCEWGLPSTICQRLSQPF